MKYLVALMAIILVAVLAVTCQTMPVTKGAQSQPQPSPATATLFAPPTGMPGPVQITVMGSGFLTSTYVQLEMCGQSWGDPVQTNSCGCFDVTLVEPAGVTGEVYAIEAYVGDTLWATFPWIHS
jgi:hypothetical protein